MIKVSFEAENKTKLYEEIIGFLGIEAVVSKAKSSQDTVLTPKEGEAPLTEKVKKVRKSRKKAEVTSEKEKEEREGLGRPISGPERNLAIKKGEIVTKTAVSDALQKLNIAKGLEVCKSVLDEYDCKRVGDLPEENYKEFIAACTKNMA